MGGLRRTGGFVVGILAATFVVTASVPGRSAHRLDEQQLGAIQTALWRGKEPARIRAIRVMSAYVQPAVKAILFQVLTTDPSVHVRSAALMVLAPRVGRKDLPALRMILSLKRDRGLKRLLDNLVMKLDNGKGSAPKHGEAAHVRKKARAKNDKAGSGVSVFFSLNVGMQTVQHYIPLANVYGQFGLRIKRFEISLDLGDPVIPMPAIALGMRASYYSVFSPGFRLRHGVSIDFLISPGEESEFWGAMVKFYLCDMSIRLSKYTWFEISAFGLGTGIIHSGYEPGATFGLTIGLRFGL